MGKILRAVTNDGTAKISVITAPDMVERARNIHHLHPVGTAALGRTLCGASLLGEMLKEDNAALTLRIQGGGPIGTILAVSDNAGNVRGYVSHPEVDLPIRERDGKLDVSGAVGREGLLTVSRDIGLREPYSGSSALVSGEIAEDLAAFLTESDQLGSACALGVLVNPDGSVKAAGGFIMQLMPNAAEETVKALEDNIFLMDQLTTILDEDGAEAVIAQVFKGLEWHKTAESDMAYKCYCSRERVLGALAFFPRTISHRCARRRRISRCAASSATPCTTSPPKRSPRSTRRRRTKKHEDFGYAASAGRPFHGARRRDLLRHARRIYVPDPDGAQRACRLSSPRRGRAG